VLVRSKGICEFCEERAPFQRRDGSGPYLEPHHIHRVSDGGPDDPRFVAALCPNCHRNAHYGVDGDQINRDLEKRIVFREKQFDEEFWASTPDKSAA
jgi:5-methylcytosine-specific restriction protein A